MHIVIALGNPGRKYESTRHNAGWMALDVFAAEEGLHFTHRAIFHADVASFGQFILAKPDTFMNESGKAARALMRQYDGELIVVHDDIAIPLGEVKCSEDRGAGGHNGVQSIIDALGRKDFVRIRIGVRPVHPELERTIAPPDGFEKFLLADFAPMEYDVRDEGLERAVAIIKSLPHKSKEEIMNQYN